MILRKRAHLLLLPFIACAGLGSPAVGGSAPPAVMPSPALPPGGSGAIAAVGPGSVSRQVLPDGVTLLVRDNPSADVVAMEVISRVGTRYEAPTEAGLATLTLRTAIAGTAERSGSSIQAWFEDRGSSLNAQAHPDYSELGAVVMASSFRQMAEVMAGVVTHATLSLDSFTAARRTLVLSLADREEEAATYQSLRTLLADGTAYGRPESGLKATLETLRPEDVDRFYREMFAPQQLVVSVSGRIQPDAAFELLRNLFGGLTGVVRTAEPPPIRTAVREPSSMVLGGHGSEAWIMVGFLTPGVTNQDYAAVTVLNALIGGANSGLLPSHFRDRRGVYDSGSFVQPFASQTHIVGYVRADPLLWDAQQQKLRPVVDQLQRDLLAIFSSLAEHGATAEQVDAAREYAWGQYLRGQEHNRDAAGYLGWYDALGLGASYDRKLEDAIHAVTPADVNRVAHTYLQERQAATVVMMPAPSAG